MKAREVKNQEEEIIEVETKNEDVMSVHVDAEVVEGDEKKTKKGLLGKIPKPIRIIGALILGVGAAMGIYEIGKSAGRSSKEVDTEELSQDEWLETHMNQNECESSEEEPSDLEFTKF